MEQCSIVGCSGLVKGRGWCGRHYQKWLKYGDPISGRTATMAGAPMDFVKMASEYADMACLLWPYGCAGKGYGTLAVNGKSEYAHRVVCEIVRGPSPSASHEVAHSCGNGHLGCVAGNHLRWATRTENFSDKIGHGTQLFGERTPMAKLSSLDVDTIRSRYSAGGVSQYRLAREFGISQRHVSDLVRGRSWRRSFSCDQMGKAAVDRAFPRRVA